MNNKKIIMIHFGRSGSTVIARMLDKHSKVSWREEIVTLAEQQGNNISEWHKGDYVKLIDDLKSEKEFVGFELKPINFFKTPHVSLENIIDHYKSDSDTTFVFLQRNNTLRRYISAMKAAMLDLYHVRADKNEAPPPKKTIHLKLTDLHDYDTDTKAPDLVSLLRGARQKESEMLSFLNDSGLDFLHLTYEEHVERNPVDAYNIMCTFGYLSTEAQEVSLRKTSAGIEKDISNFSEVVQALEGTEFEWMVQG